MKSIAHVVALVVVVSCGNNGGDDSSQPAAPTSVPLTCTADQEGVQRCGEAHRLEQCLSGTWMLSVNCDAIAHNCVTTGDNQAECQPRDTSGLCTAAEEGQKRCKGDLVQYCDGTTRNAMVDCAALGETCALTGPGDAACDDGTTPPTCEPVGGQRCAAGDVLEQCDGTAWVTEMLSE